MRRLPGRSGDRERRLTMPRLFALLLLVDVALIALFLAFVGVSHAATVSVRDETVCGSIKGIPTCWHEHYLEVRDGAGEQNEVLLTEPASEQVAVHDRAGLSPGQGCDHDGTGGALCRLPVGLTALVVAGDRDDLVDASRLARMASLEGGGGSDVLLDGTRDGYLYGQEDDDLLEGGAGLDLLDGGPGADDLRGGGGPDIVYAASGPDRVRGGYGRDDIAAVDGARDRIDCGPGRDRVTADRRDRLRRCERVRRRAP